MLTRRSQLNARPMTLYRPMGPIEDGNNIQFVTVAFDQPARKNRGVRAAVCNSRRPLQQTEWRHVEPARMQP